jgi:DNA-binding MarR family transcriptional regulator
LLSDAVSKLVGANSTDLECLDLLGLGGPTTAGRLATHTGLTTGAMTAVIDRLERAGFARRVRDAEDRRRVLVEALPERLRQIELLYSPLAAAVARLNNEYGDRQLAVVVDYLSRAVTLATEHVVWLQKEAPLTGRAPVRRRRRKTAGGRRSRSQVMRG